MSEFKTYTLDQLCIVGSSKRVHLSDYVQQGIPFYRSKEVIELSSGKNISEQLFISSEKYSEIKSKFPVPQENDVLITAVGTIGEILVVKDPNFYFKDGNLIWLRNINFEIIDIDYLYYFLKSDLFQKTIKYNNIGAVQKALTIDFLKTVKITLPSLDNQRKLISVLKSIDKKLRINNQINQELEAMAKTLYDYWFVQFDFPDQNGKPYKSSGGKMVYHPGLKREIPEGWGVENLFDIADVQYGYPFSTDYFNSIGEGVPVIRIRDILGNDITNYSTEEVEDKYKINVGDVLIGMDGNFHMNYWIKEDCYLNQRVVKVNSDKLPNMVLKYQIEPFIKLREKSVSRTTVGHLSDKDLKAINVILPRDKYLSSIFEKFESILENIIINQQQNQELTQLRDWLLPMLMNGQVKVE
ncbi:restriction endonuclease subunit S [Streptococcus mitis]|uniref:restriction endonuclease subunit S n=1 Tax=Streptococcus mitis TaxID=28037 RepID=UPI0021B7479C|nr:restriction endonuclease subunit S [Streptococcus mitis]